MREAIDPRRIAALCVLFFLARLLLVLCAADRISEPDLAEVKLLAVAQTWDGAGPERGWLELAREGANAPHGGYLPSAIAIGLLSRVAPDYLALKLFVLLLATVAFGAWVLAAHALGGRFAAVAMAVLWLLMPPGALGPSLVGWGSHPEAAALFAPGAAQLLLARRPALVAIAGALLGLACGFSLLLVPAAALLCLGFAWDAWWEEGPEPWLPRAAALAMGLLPLGLLGWLSGSGSASVVEDAGSSPWELLHQARHDVDPVVRDTWAELIPPSIWGPQPFGEVLTTSGRDELDLAWALILLAAAIPALLALLRDRALRGRALTLLVGVPLVQLTVLATLAPRRPYVPPRYLGMVWGPLLLLLAVGVGRSWMAKRGKRSRTAIAVLLAAAFCLPGAAAQVGLLDLDRLGGFASYRPARYVEAEIGHVRYDEAEATNRFLRFVARRGEPPPGFGAAAGVRGADALLLEAPTLHPVDPADLLERRAELLRRTPLDQRAIVDRNLGWGLAVFAPDRSGTWLSVLAHVGDQRAAIAEGVGMGLRSRGLPGCEQLRRVIGPDRDAVLRGARQLTDPDLPACSTR